MCVCVCVCAESFICVDVIDHIAEGLCMKICGFIIIILYVHALCVCVYTMYVGSSVSIVLSLKSLSEAVYIVRALCRRSLLWQQIPDLKIVLLNS